MTCFENVLANNCGSLSDTIAKIKGILIKLKSYSFSCKVAVYQGIIQKKSASGSRTLPFPQEFFLKFYFDLKMLKLYLNRCILVSATATYQTKCPFGPDDDAKFSIKD